MKRAVNVIVGLLLLLINAPAFAQANCALRNPDRQIYELFPDATSYRTVEAKVDSTLRPRIEERLGSSLARTDEGTHSAYVVLQGQVPIGIVHARAETGSRGSIELVWALDLNLNVREFRVQRSRERHTDLVESETFRQKLAGGGLPHFRNLLTRGNDAVNLAALEMPAESSSIAHTVVLCGLKTRLITEIAFAESLTPARLLGRVHEAFPETQNVARIRVETAPEGFDPVTYTMLRAVGANGDTLGWLAYGRWAEHDAQPETWWIISPERSLISAEVIGDGSDRVASDFESLGGRTAADEGGSEVEQLAHGVLSGISG